MIRLHTTDDLQECRLLWERLWPRENLFDLWEVRACFHQGFGRQVRFITVEEHGDTVGLLALAWIEEEQYWGAFPGETWHGRTWLEQNRIPVRRAELRGVLLEAAPSPTRVRYLIRSALPQSVDPETLLDEVGYLFEPPAHGYSFDAYLGQISRKSRKKLRRELDALEAQGVSYRHDHLPDVARFVEMNLAAFGDRSYFHDPRFLDSFQRLLAWLQGAGMLRVTSVLVGGALAAVDVGARWRSDYTVLAGGTAPEHAGVAKLINLHHLRWACEQRLERVDFLCGDFGWKQRFHLAPRALYEVCTPVVAQPIATAPLSAGSPGEPIFQSARGRIHERLH